MSMDPTRTQDIKRINSTSTSRVFTLLFHNTLTEDNQRKKKDVECRSGFLKVMVCQQNLPPVLVCYSSIDEINKSESNNYLHDKVNGIFNFGRALGLILVLAFFVPHNISSQFSQASR